MMRSVCPYCRAPFAAEDDRIVCSGCDTPHHRDCYEENGGCTVFGCRCAPAEEPKVVVAAPEVRAVEATARAPQYARVIQPSSYSPLGLAAISAEPAPRVIVQTRAEPEPGKSKVKFVLLGVFLGPLGAHNFYAGFTKKAMIQLAITVLTLGYGAPMSWIWAVIDVCTVERDNKGAQFNPKQIT